jgi:hypothetical protein
MHAIFYIYVKQFPDFLWNYVLWLFLCLFVLGDPEVLARGIMLTRKALYHLSSISSSLCFRLFFRLGLTFLPRAGLRLILPPYRLLHSWQLWVQHHTWLIGWDGGLANFLWGLISNLNPPNFCFLSSWKINISLCT